MTLGQRKVANAESGRIVQAAQGELGGVDTFWLLWKLVRVAAEMNGMVIDREHLHHSPRSILVLRGVETANFDQLIVFRHGHAPFL